MFGVSNTTQRRRFKNEIFDIVVEDRGDLIFIETHNIEEGFYFGGPLSYIGYTHRTVLGVNFFCFGSYESKESVINKDSTTGYNYRRIVEFLQKAEEYVKSPFYPMRKQLEDLEKEKRGLNESIQTLVSEVEAIKEANKCINTTPKECNISDKGAKTIRNIIRELQEILDV